MTDEEIMNKLKFNFDISKAGTIKIENELVSCSGSVTLLRDNRYLPLKFKEVGGNFDCSYRELVSLRGAPQSVGGDFNCNVNQLTSLLSAPQSVGGDFSCEYNPLTSLAGAPQSIRGSFWHSESSLRSLAGAPQSVGGHFSCNVTQLASLRGAPRYVHKGFQCVGYPLRSLTGAPQYVGWNFELTYGENLALLPLLMIKGCKRVLFVIIELGDLIEDPERKSLSAILNRYLGTGTQGMLPCADEMIEAGYGSNAHYD